MEYNLENRTMQFSKDILKFFKKFQIKVINENIVRQVLRSSTSIGANYCEANGAVSKPDFKQKIYICKKEAKETLYWLNLLKEMVDESDENDLKKLVDESNQLTLIFSKITSSLKSN